MYYHLLWKRPPGAIIWQNLDKLNKCEIHNMLIVYISTPNIIIIQYVDFKEMGWIVNLLKSDELKNPVVYINVNSAIYFH